MTFYSVPMRLGTAKMGTRRLLVGLASEKDSGVKHTHLGPGGNGYAFQKGPTDAVGQCTLTFSGVNANSEVRLYLSDMTEQTGVENSTADPVLSVPLYAAGSANNILRVVIINPLYKIKEFNITVSGTELTIPVQQELDKWYNNPA